MSKPDLTTYGGLTFTPFFVGQIAEGGPTNIETRINEAATAIDLGAPVTAGVAVAAGAVPNCKILNTNGQVPMGIAVRHASSMTADSSGNINFPQRAAVGVMKMGKVAVLAAENVTAEDACVALPASPTGLGGITGGAANGTSRMAFPGAKWLTTTASGAVGLVEILTA